MTAMTFYHQDPAPSRSSYGLLNGDNQHCIFKNVVNISQMDLCLYGSGQDFNLGCSFGV